jgi:hypothetical protein
MAGNDLLSIGWDVAGGWGFDLFGLAPFWARLRSPNLHKVRFFPS